ncbi:hypothetical protein ACC712_38070, partial [Rhizobium ruizarguesonis]
PLAVRLVPDFLRSKMSPLEDRALVAVDRKVGDMVAGFEDQYLRADTGIAPGQNTRLAFNLDKDVFFDPESQARIV